MKEFIELELLFCAGVATAGRTRAIRQAAEKRIAELKRMMGEPKPPVIPAARRSTVFG